MSVSAPRAYRMEAASNKVDRAGTYEKHWLSVALTSCRVNVQASKSSGLAGGTVDGIRLAGCGGLAGGGRGWLRERLSTGTPRSKICSLRDRLLA